MDIKKAFKTYYVSALKRYYDFKGRTSRKAYWMFVLFNVLISWVAIALDNILGTEEVGKLTLWGIHNGMFNNFYGLVMLIPGLAIAVRRLHDVGKNGKILFFLFLPVVGWFIVFMELIREGDPRENEFGPVPEDGDVPQPGNHPYAPQDSSQKTEDSSQKKNESTSFDVAAIRKEVEEIVAKNKEAGKKEKPKIKVEKVDRTVKWGRDRGAKDFRSPADKKKTKR